MLRPEHALTRCQRLPRHVCSLLMLPQLINAEVAQAPHRVRVPRHEHALLRFQHLACQACRLLMLPQYLINCQMLRLLMLLSESGCVRPDARAFALQAVVPCPQPPDAAPAPRAKC